MQKNVILSLTYNALRGLICSIIVCFFVFSPLSTHVHTAHGKAGLGGFATEPTQIKNTIESSISATANTATAASTALISGFNFQLITKELLLDGLAWAFAKGVVNQLTQSLLNWINSGFSGSPQFISDLDQILFNALDQTAGEFIRGLGGIGEFVCSPFRLDVQAALSINYAIARSGMPSGPSAASCTLTGIGDNIEGFLGGFTDGGIEEWVKITANEQNTPYGAYLAAEAKLNARLVNAAGQEIEIAGWGDGFLSRKICEGIEGTNASGNCIISTPGKVISEALTFQLSTGPRALIEADEINEIIGALINQLVSKGISGISGLLGLTGGTGYTDYTLNPAGDGSTPLVDDAVNEVVATNNTFVILQMTQQIATENSFLTLIDNVITEANRQLAVLSGGSGGGSGGGSTVVSTTTVGDLTVEELAALSGSGVSSGSSATESQLRALIADATTFRPLVVTNISEITTYRDQVQGTEISTVERQRILQEFAVSLASGEYSSASTVEAKRVEWNRVLQ